MLHVLQKVCVNTVYWMQDKFVSKLQYLIFCCKTDVQYQILLTMRPLHSNNYWLINNNSPMQIDEKLTLKIVNNLPTLVLKVVTFVYWFISMGYVFSDLKSNYLLCRCIYISFKQISNIKWMLKHQSECCVHTVVFDTRYVVVRNTIVQKFGTFYVCGVFFVAS